jgi:energy-converting hydrogenase B subunit Q
MTCVYQRRIDLPGGEAQLLDDLRALPVVRRAQVVETLQKIYGKRIIIIGGGAQVVQVAIGAISEADRHNIRGEHISVDTIPLVGEQPLADAVRAVARLPRAKGGGAGRLADGRRDRESGARGASTGVAGGEPEHY